MPELPDLEVFRANVFQRLTSKRLTGVEVFSLRKVYTTKPMLMNELMGRNLLRIDRVGKELYFDFGERRIIAVHLMLNGEISIAENEAAVELISHKVFALRFERETLVISDKGGLCTVKYKPLANGTPDAFDATFSLKYFSDVARERSHANIKAFLIDQHVVKGIGNAYADEILWTARISPRSLVGKIPEEKLADLYHAIDAVLHSAIASIKRISPDIISGEERSFLKVHNRARKQTETGHPIKVEKIAEKTTYYTAEQVLYL